MSVDEPAYLMSLASKVGMLGNGAAKIPPAAPSERATGECIRMFGGAPLIVGATPSERHFCDAWWTIKVAGVHQALGVTDHPIFDASKILKLHFIMP